MFAINMVKAFEDNYIFLVVEQHSKQAIIIDPGDIDTIMSYIEYHQITPHTILVTHHHSDHIGAISELFSEYHCDIIAPAKEARLVPDCKHIIKGEQTLNILGIEFQVLETPGHTKGHVSFYFESLNALFCGDTLFAMGCGRLMEGTASQLWHSLQKIAKLPDDTLIYCAHEYSLTNAAFTESMDMPQSDLFAQRVETFKSLRAKDQPTIPVLLGEEKQTNLFLRANEPAIIEKMQAIGEIDCFSKLRNARNHFTA